MFSSLCYPRFPYVQVAGSCGTPQELAHYGYYSLIWEDESGQYPIGCMLDRVVREVALVPSTVRGDMRLDSVNRTLHLFHLPTEQDRTRAVTRLTQFWRERGTFKLLQGWRDELWPVYGRTGELIFSVERSAMGLFGTMRYGVHLTAYVADSTASHGMRLWVPKRAADKSTFPGMLDNTVAGGLITGEDPLECVIREAGEEASLPADLVRRQARCVGTVTYIYITDEKQVGEGDFVYPECQWIYDLELPTNLTPHPRDGEVEAFYLHDVNQVQKDLSCGKYKNNCALVLIDFFIRHAILTRDNEVDLEAINHRLHRALPFPGPHQADWPILFTK
ncbi:hypothetical protein CDD83_5065 [Cordyceps sp. RAO-2017]|nr:hypothetical protein CDD83_5065 [Cordyceps sp. RAO-2017]